MIGTTPHHNASTLVTGHFRQTHGYLAWRPEGTNDWLLIHTLAGKGRLGHARGEHILQPGDTVLLRPGTPHDYGVEHSLQRWELLWTHFAPRAHWIEWLRWPEISDGLMHVRLPLPYRRRMVASFKKAHRLASISPRHRLTFAMHALEEVILICDQCNPLSMQAQHDERVRGAIDFIGRKLADPITLSEIADASSLSISRLSSLFRKHLHCSPMQYLEAQRIDRARSLLKLTSLSVKEIAQRVGFASQFYFSLRFKAATSRSPRDYRAEA